MGSRIGRHLHSHFVGYVALVLAMSGTAYAVGANSIGDKELANNSVGSSEIEPQAVKTNDIAEGAVGAEQWDDGSAFCYVGEILQLGYDFAPVGTYPADGRLLQINQDQALFSLYGTTFGGDGQQTFGLPKLSGPNGTSYVICSGSDGIYPQRP